MIIFAANLSVGQAIPFLLTLAGEVTGKLRPILFELKAGRDGYLRVAAKATLPTIGKTLDVAKKIASAAEAATSYSLPASFALQAVDGLVARVSARVSRLQALLSLIGETENVAAGGGIYLFVYEGTLADLEDVLGGPLGLAAQAGLSADAPVFVPVYAADASNGPLVSAMKAAFAGAT